MSAQHNAFVNQMIVRLYRSLLQYMGECGPWSAAPSTEESVLLDLVREQQQDVGRLVDLLEARDWSIEFGNFPSSLTDLHYLSLDFLLPSLLADERAIIQDIEAVTSRIQDDAQASRLLGEVAAAERSRLSQLEQLAARRRTPALSGV